MQAPAQRGRTRIGLVADATAKLVEARACLAQAHIAFRSTQTEIGLEAFSYGDISECPPSKTGEAAPPLKVVA